MISKKVKFKKIKMWQVEPGMVINTRPKDKDTCSIALVTAVDGFRSIEYTHLSYIDAHGGQMIGSLDRDAKVEVITGEVRAIVMKSIKNDVFKWYNDAKDDINTIRLIEALTKGKV